MIHINRATGNNVVVKIIRAQAAKILARRSFNFKNI